jgi:hypothetical protein
MWAQYIGLYTPIDCCSLSSLGKKGHHTPLSSTIGSTTVPLNCGTNEQLIKDPSTKLLRMSMQHRSSCVLKISTYVIKGCGIYMQELKKAKLRPQGRIHAMLPVPPPTYDVLRRELYLLVVALTISGSLSLLNSYKCIAPKDQGVSGK